MPLVDDRGRVAGRLNLIDAAVLLTVAVLIPLAYGSYLLFRSPSPKLLGVEPNKFYQGNKLRVEVQGRDLRPFMRVSFNNAQGRSYFINSTKSAVVDLPDLAAGVYDVVLYDYSQEVDRLPKALTVMPLSLTPTFDIEVAGVFFGVENAVLSELKPGRVFQPGDAEAEILSVDAPVPATIRVRAGAATLAVRAVNARELPATLRVRCTLTTNPDGTVGCFGRSSQQPVLVARDSVLTYEGASRLVSFQIGEVRPTLPSPISEAHVRFVVSPELFAHMKVGDRDSSPGAAGRLRQATITGLGAPRAISAADAGREAPIGGVLRAVDATVRVPVDPVRAEWTYKDAPFKIGAPFMFETPQYVVHGEIIDMTVPKDGPRDPVPRP
jgi:hypothetical protein